MKKFFTLLFVFLFFSTIYAASSVEDDKYIYFSNQGQVVGKILVEDFKTLVNASKEYYEIIDAEQNNRLKIKIEKSLWDIKESKKYEGDMIITWTNKEGNTIKELTVFINMEIKKESESKIVTFYRNVAPWAFPISFIINCALILIIAL